MEATTIGKQGHTITIAGREVLPPVLGRVRHLVPQTPAITTNGSAKMENGIITTAPAARIQDGSRMPATIIIWTAAAR